MTELRYERERRGWSLDDVANRTRIPRQYIEALEDGKKIKTFHFDGMWGIGTPEDLDYFNKFHGV